MRSLLVAHFFWKVVNKGTERFLFRSHDTWSDNGRAMLAPLTKKIAAWNPKRPVQSVRRTLDLLRRENLTGAPPLAHLRILPTTTTRLRSPAKRIVTDYRIVTATARCPHDQQKFLAHQLGGVWLTRSEALAEAMLSPTARLAVQRIRAVPAGPVAAHALTGDWTTRLLYARDQDHRVFGPLFEDMKPYLRSQLRDLIDNSDDRDDVLSETCLQTFVNLDAYEPITSPATWVGRILHNTAVNLLRRQGVRRRHSAPAIDQILEVADPAADPAEAVAEEDSLAHGRALLHQELAAMTPLQRLAWRLRHQENMEYHEISKALDVKVGTLATWFRRVRVNLKCDEMQR